MKVYRIIEFLLFWIGIVILDRINMWIMVGVILCILGNNMALLRLKIKGVPND